MPFFSPERGDEELARGAVPANLHPLRKVMPGPSNRRPQPVRRPVSVRAAPVAKLSAPRRPARVSMAGLPQSGGGAFWLGMCAVAGVAGFFWWQGARSKPAQKTAFAPETIVPPAAVVETKRAATLPAAPVEIAKVEPMAMAPAPMPPKPEPAPMPVAPPPPVAAAAPDIFALPAILDPVAGKSAANVKRAEAALDEAFSKGRWAEYRDWLRAGLGVEVKKMTDFTMPQSYDRVLKNPLFYGALLQHTLLHRLPENARALLTEDSGSRPFFTWLLKTPDATESLLKSLRPEDGARDVLRVWSRLAAEDDTVRGKYRELALAIALVFDKPFRPEWNSQTLEITPRERFDFYKEKNEKGQLQANIHRYPASDLVWVVADPVPLSEMEWALRKVRLRQKNWGEAYGMIKYDMDKAVTGQAKEAYNGYTFAEILEKGGICADRSYFAAYTARANGIPAAIIGGDGPLGGHAWIRWMPTDDKWAESGRIGGYAAGTTTDPQTGRSISEMEFVRRSDPREAGEQRTLTAHRFLWLADLHAALKDNAKTDSTIDFSLKTSPRLSVGWDAKLAHWRTFHREDDVKEWDDLVRELKKRFSDDKVMLAEARKLQEEFIFPRQDVRDSIHDLKQDAKKFRDPGMSEASKDTGTMAELVKRQGQLLAESGKYDSLHQLYRRALEENGGNPAAWRRLAGDYFALCSADESEREKSARLIEASYERYVETGTMDWFAVGSQNSAHALVADCWKTCGNTEKAERIAKEMERRTKKSKREAL